MVIQEIEWLISLTACLSGREIDDVGPPADGADYVYVTGRGADTLYRPPRSVVPLLWLQTLKAARNNFVACMI